MDLKGNFVLAINQSINQLINCTLNVSMPWKVMQWKHENVTFSKSKTGNQMIWGSKLSITTLPTGCLGWYPTRHQLAQEKTPRLSHQCRWKWLRIMAQALFSEMVKGTFCLPWQTLWVWVWKWRMIALICPDVWQCSQCCRDNDPMILFSGKPICAWGCRSVIQWVQDPGHQKPTYTSRATKMYWLSKAQTIPNSA